MKRLLPAVLVLVLAVPAFGGIMLPGYTPCDPQIETCPPPCDPAVEQCPDGGDSAQAEQQEQEAADAADLLAALFSSLAALL